MPEPSKKTNADSTVTTDLISCIVPVWNGERYLSEALESILDQTYRPIEIIVVDDGSTDATPEVVSRKAGPIRYFARKHAGAPAALNDGIQASRGALLAFLDADDLWHPEKLARQHQRYRQRPELMISCTHIMNFWTPELPEPPTVAPMLKSPMTGYVLPTLLARREAFEVVGLFNSALLHSYKTDWFMRSMEAGLPSEMLPEVLVQRRLHGGNMSFRRAGESRQEYFALLKASLDRRRGKEDRKPVDGIAASKGETDVETT